MKEKDAFDISDEPIVYLGPEVTRVRSEAELHMVSNLDALVYGAECIDHEGLYGWWKACPNGIYILWKGDELIGALGLWPLKKSTYHRMIKGKIDEVDLTADDISEREAGRTYAYWYAADIVLREEYRGQPENWLVFLLVEAIKQWLDEGDLAPTVHLCALGFKPRGISLLQNLRFQHAGGCTVKTPTGKPVYERVLSIEDIREVPGQLMTNQKGTLKTSPPSPPAEKAAYDVFISYRRGPVSGLMAQLIHNELQRRNLNVFLDVADPARPRFDTAICEFITHAPHFILILSEGCFDRCSEEEDFFTQEIALALEKERNIVPIEMDKFVFPKKSDLPSNIRDVKRYTAIPHTLEHPEVLIDTIMQYIRSWAGVTSGDPSRARQAAHSPKQNEAASISDN